MVRGGRHKDRSEPERRCIATGQSGGRAGLIRFVVGPDEIVVPDISGKLPGRGIWVTAGRAELETAIKKRLFSRGAKRQVTVPEGLLDLVEGLLARRLVDRLGLCRKAGLVHNGFDTVKARLKEGPVRALIEASDGSEAQKQKLRPLSGVAARISCLSGAELGLAFGRDHVIHAALDAGGLTDQALAEAARLHGLRDTGDTEPAPLLSEDVVRDEPGLRPAMKGKNTA
ncbi:MAG: RNA-binding protein [Pseudomonadota bacterium]